MSIEKFSLLAYLPYPQCLFKISLVPNYNVLNAHRVST